MAQWYRNALVKAMNKEVDWDTDSFKLTLHTATYTPNLDTDAYVAALTNELTTAGNYTAGGFTLTCSAPTYTAANSWGVTAATTTAYVVGQVVKPSGGNTNLYQCVVSGTSGGSAPTWPTVLGQTVADGTVTWANVGKGIVVITASTVTQATFTAGPFRYAVISDRSTGVAATEPLLGLIDFGSNQTGGGGTLTLTFDATLGVLLILMP